MKIAGSKNAGAWHRFNKKLAEIREENFPRIAEMTAGFYAAHGAEADAYFAALQNLAGKVGMELPASPSNASAMVSRWFEIGVPLQVWMGKLSFDTYTEVADKYVPDHAEEAHALGKVLRRFCRRWVLIFRQINDLTDTGLQEDDNPGGQPDAVQGN